MQNTYENSIKGGCGERKRETSRKRENFPGSA